MRSTKRSRNSETYQDGEWFYGDPVVAMSDRDGNDLYVVPIGLTSYGSTPVLLLSPSGPTGNFMLYRNGREVPDLRDRFTQHVDKWLVGIGLPPGEHRLNVWAFWQFEGRPSGRTEREALSAFYDRVAKHGPPPPAPTWSDPDVVELVTEVEQEADRMRERLMN